MNIGSKTPANIKGLDVPFAHIRGELLIHHSFLFIQNQGCNYQTKIIAMRLQNIWV